MVNMNYHIKVQGIFNHKSSYATGSAIINYDLVVVSIEITTRRNNYNVVKKKEGTS